MLSDIYAQKIASIWTETACKTVRYSLLLLDIENVTISFRHDPTCTESDVDTDWKLMDLQRCTFDWTKVDDFLFFFACAVRAPEFWRSIKRWYLCEEAALIGSREDYCTIASHCKREQNKSEWDQLNLSTHKLDCLLLHVISSCYTSGLRCVCCCRSEALANVRCSQMCCILQCYHSVKWCAIKVCWCRTRSKVLTVITTSVA